LFGGKLEDGKTSLSLSLSRCRDSELALCIICCPDQRHYHDRVVDLVAFHRPVVPVAIENLSIAAGGPYSPYSPASSCIPARLGCEQQANGRKMKIDFTLKLIWFLLLGPFNLCSLNKS